MHNHKNNNNSLLNIIRKIQSHQTEEEDIFDENNNSHIAETVNRVNDIDRENLVVNLVMAADAELTLYKLRSYLKQHKLRSYLILSQFKVIRVCVCQTFD